MHSYLAEKNFLYLYLYKMFYRGSTAPIHIFVGTGLVAMGADIATILLFYAITTFMVIISSPFGVAIIHKYGIKVAAISAVIFRSLFFVCLLMVEQGQHSMLWVGALFYGMAYGFLPLKDILEAIYIDGDDHRGKQMTMGIVLAGIMISVVVALSGYLLSIYGFIALISFSITLQICSIFILTRMSGESLHVENYKIKNCFKAAAIEKPLTGVYPMVWVQQLVFTAGVVILPLYMFSVIDDMKTFAFIAAGAALLEVFIILIFGRFLDKTLAGSAHRKSAIMTFMSSMVIILFVKTPLSALLADSFNKISMNMMVVATNTSIHKILRSRDKGKLLLYSAYWQMTYSFFEVFSLLGLVLVYYYWGTAVFTVAFSLAAFGGILNYYNFSINKEKQRKETSDGT